MGEMTGRKKYRLFLQGDLWKSLSQAKKRGVSRCQNCGKKSRFLECHHVKYPENWEDTQVTDLVVLCRRCHKRIHGIYTRQWIEHRARTARENAIFHRTHCLSVKLAGGRELRERDRKFLHWAITAYPKTDKDSAVWFHCNNVLEMEKRLYGIH